MTATIKGANAIFLFIAELNGYKSGTVEGKLAFGKQCYVDNHLHTLDYSQEADRSNAHENIWLSRLYDDLDNFYCLAPLDRLDSNLDVLVRDDYKWTVPIELDASASMLQWIGILLGDSRLLSMTNVIGDTLSDPWAFQGISRTQFKHAATPMLYGSSKACHELWQSKGHKYTLDQVKAFNTELSSGALGLANQFKEFLIHNCKPTAEMQLHVRDEKFTIECNRFRNVGERTSSYDIYDSIDSSIRRIHHTQTSRIPDLDQFRRFFMTALV